MTSIPIALGPGKTWKIQVDSKPNPNDVERFVQVIRIVLGAPEKIVSGAQEKREPEKAKG